MKENLYLIEETLLGLTELRDAAVSQDDAETVAILDQEIEAYLTKEAAKVYSYAALIRQRQDAAAICKARAEDLAARAKAMQADADRLKGMALRVMQRFDVKALTAAEVTLRVQGNGGVKPLELTGEPLPDDKQYVQVTMTLADFEKHVHKYGEVPKFAYQATEPEPATGLIREALERGEQVPGAKLLPRGSHLRVIWSGV
jgi:Gp157 protein